jgi:hypothetical protein
MDGEQRARKIMHGLGRQPDEVVLHSLPFGFSGDRSRGGLGKCTEGLLAVEERCVTITRRPDRYAGYGRHSGGGRRREKAR